MIAVLSDLAASRMTAVPLSNFSILHLGYCRASRMTAVPLAFFSIVRLGYFALFCVCFENTEACIIILPGVLRNRLELAMHGYFVQLG